MKTSEVPQDNIDYYDGESKLMYAQDEDGVYVTVESTGWKDEEYVTKMAVKEFNDLSLEAFKRARQGIESPLFFHMFSCRHDLASLSQSTGIWKWRIKRHAKTESFKRLSQKILTRYAEALGISVETLKTLPDKYSYE